MTDEVSRKLAEQATDTLAQILRDLFMAPSWDMYPVHADDFVAWKKHFILGKGCGCEGMDD